MQGFQQISLFNILDEENQEELKEYRSLENI